MTKINDISLAPATRRDDQSDNSQNASGLPFDTLLLHARGPLETAQAAMQAMQPQADSNNGGIKLSFQPRSNAAVEQSTPGSQLDNDARAASRHKRHERVADAGRQGRPERTETQGGAYDQATRAKAKAAETVPGRGSAHAATPDVQRPVGKSGIALGMRGADTRADGTPVVRDASGTAHVVNATNPEQSIGKWAQSATDSELGAFAQKAKQNIAAAKGKATSSKEAFAKKNEAIQREAGSKLAESVRQNMDDPKHVLGDKPKTAQTQTQADSSAKADGVKADTQAHNEKQSGDNPRQQGGDGQRFSKSADAAKATEAAASELKSGESKAKTFSAALNQVRSAAVKPVTQRGGQPTGAANIQAGAPVDATAVAQAAQQGQRADAASHMAKLLGARIEYMLNNQRPEMRLSLNPRQLGNLQIRLINTGDTHVLRIQAGQESTGRMIEMAAPQLAQQLSRAGVTISNVAVDYGSTDFTQGGPGGQADGSSQDSELPESLFADEANPQPEPQADTQPRAASAHDGQLDVLV